MKIGLFGGSFDPPHRAHHQLVQTVLDQGLFDEVWYVPVGKHQRAFAHKNMSSIEHRLAMLKLIQSPQTKIELYEVESGEPSYTHQTLRAMTAAHPEHKFSWIMGSDQLEKLYLWKCDRDEQCFPEVLAEFDYYVYPREGYEMKLPFEKLKEITDVEPMPDSSTQVRQRVRDHQSLGEVVSPEVGEYIITHYLYLS